MNTQPNANKKTNTNNQLNIKRGNIEAVFNTIAESGGISRARLSKTLSLSRSTVTVIVDELKSKGLVVDTGVCDEGSSGIGRTAFAVNVNSADNYILGVGFTADTVMCVAYDLKIDPVAEEEIPFDISRTLIAEAVESCVRRLIARLPGKRIWALGCVSFVNSGFIDYRKNEFRLTDLSGINRNGLALRELSERLDMPAHISDGSIILGMLEYRKYHRGSKVLAYIYITDGVCIGIFQDGKLLHGAYSPMSEFGHMSVDLAGPRCICGNRGCFEMYVSTNALIRYYIEALGHEADALVAAAPSWAEIIDLYTGSDPYAEKAVARLNDALAVGITNLINLVNPDTVVLGGTLKKYGEDFLGRIREKALSSAIEQYRESPQIVYARHDDNLILPGVAHDAYRQFISTILFSQ